MKSLIECIPNISEGRRDDVVAAVRGAALSAAKGVLLLDSQSDRDHNRSVFTFLGDGPSLVTAMTAMVGEALSRIDLREHQGAHPRVGAVDVVPFVPIRGATSADCVALARELGSALAERYALPVFLYEDAAASEARRNLATIRQGEFEGLGKKLQDPAWKPDFGPSAPHESGGATVVGARAPLVAYNVNLGTADLSVADRIAKSIRHISGGYRFVKAMGVKLEARGIVQVSINMTNFEKTPLHRVFETVRSEAERYGVPVVGSEIVGLVPQGALLASAAHFLRLEADPAPQVLENKLLDLAFAARDAEA
ncbi:glutamate formimidoyltransferase [Acidobacteria bacterium ACD]|nr:MAG: glutamate formimidoyltransferase [Acidobacteriota bacterium]MCE7960345.1 glutamate formimidoyltransferase [Acidobacteria bacterium ACB2]MDL1951913.1 glutamate formimidoyltransferase [Acidobacteria bacterium ACD]